MEEETNAWKSSRTEKWSVTNIEINDKKQLCWEDRVLTYQTQACFVGTLHCTCPTHVLPIDYNVDSI